MNYLLLIDTRVNDRQIIIQSLLPNVEFVLFNYSEDTLERLLSKIPFNKYNSIGIFQENYQLPTYQLLNASERSILMNVEMNDPELNSWSNFIELLTYFRNKLECKVVDLMGCSILSDKNWKYVLNKLSGDLGITLNSSLDNTGAESLNGNWILESNNENLIGTYFNENIKNYKFILGGGDTVNHSLFVTASGEVYACGQNNIGQLGDGTTTNQSYPVQVKLDASTNLTNIKEVSWGNSHSIFLRNDGTVYGCGYNGLGCLGDGTKTNRIYPVQVKLNATTNLTNIINISCGRYHTLFLKSDGTVYGCGFNAFGHLGIGNSTTTITYPIQTKINSTTYLTDVSNISCGGDFSLFLKSNGTVYGSGDNYYGNLGNGTTTESSIYAIQAKMDASTNLTGVSNINCGIYHSIFLKSDGTVYGCGYNGSGCLGDGTTTNQSYPVQVKMNSTTYLTGVSNVNGLGYSTIFLKSDGTVYGSGDNYYGHLGNGTTTNQSYPVQVKLNAGTNLNGISNIACICVHSLFFKSDGTVYGCGYNGYGQLGNGTINNTNTYPVNSIMTIINSKKAGKLANDVLLNSFTLSQKKIGGYTASDMKIAGYSASDLKNAGYTASDLKAAGYTALELAYAGYSDTEITNAGYTLIFTLSDLKPFYFLKPQYTQAGYTINNLYDASYSMNDLYKIGYSVTDIMGLNKFSGLDYLYSMIPATNLKNVLNIPLSYYYSIFNLTNIPQYANEIVKLYDIYPVADLYLIGFNLDFTKKANININIMYQLVTQNIIPLNFFKIYGYTVSDLRNVPTMNAYTLLNGSYSIAELKAGGYKASEIKVYDYDTRFGITFNSLYNTGYGLYELYQAGYPYTDFSNNGFNVSNLIAAGMTVTQLNHMTNIPTITLHDYVVKYNRPFTQLIDASYIIQDLANYKTTYFSVFDFSNNGVSIFDLYDTYAFTLYDFYEGYYRNNVPSLVEIINFHYTPSRYSDCALLIPYDITIKQFYDASYSSDNLFDNGFLVRFLSYYYTLQQFVNDGLSLNELTDNANYTISDFVNVGITLDIFKANGYTAKDMLPYFTLSQIKDAGYTSADIISLRYYSIRDLIGIGYILPDLSPYYSIAELFAYGFSKYDLNIEGNVINNYCYKEKRCKYAIPSKLNSSTNQKQQSSKMTYSNTIRNRTNSYSANFSTYLSNPKLNVLLCLDNNTHTNDSSTLITTTFTGYITSKTLTVSDGDGILLNMYLIGNGIIGAPYIVRQIQNNGPPGYVGGVGIYEISSVQDISSTLITGKLKQNSAVTPVCNLNFENKTSISFDYYIRNYIYKKILQLEPNATPAQIQTHFANIQVAKSQNPQTSIYEIINTYLYP